MPARRRAAGTNTFANATAGSPLISSTVATPPATAEPFSRASNSTRWRPRRRACRTLARSIGHHGSTSLRTSTQASSAASSSTVSTTMAPMAGESIRVTRSVSVPLAEIELRTSRSSGPGGQHAQKSETRVEAVFDVEASQALSAAQKRRVLAKAGATIRAVAQDERSQLRNRELALERLTERLREALRVERRRVATKPSRAAVERRLEDKRRRSATKRRRRGADD